MIFTFLLTLLEEKWQRSLVWIVFAPYAFLDIWRLISYLAFGDSILADGSYVLTDPFIYAPLDHGHIACVLRVVDLKTLAS